jgi:DNA-binding NtrC family response regulator
VATNRFDTVLLVENEAFIALDLESMLLLAGAVRVHHAVSSREALDWLETRSADLAILDLFVSDGSTAPVAGRLRGKRTPFLVYSGHTHDSAPDAAAFGDAIWLSKPCTHAELRAAIERSLRRSL